MSDIGSDSDATIADSVEEEDANSDNSTTSCSDDDSCDVGYADCIGSLQRGQKVLFDKLESVTPDATSLHYVQDIQEQYLVLEESLRQLSNIIRLERKQLSDELEAASTTGHSTSDRSFQQQLLQLSDKQKTLLKCFESQKRLGSQLKVLISKQNHYSTRSKMLLKQTHSQENKSSGCYRNTKQLGTKEAKVTPFKPIQPVESSIKLPSHSQLTSAVVGQLKRAAFNSNVTLSDEQHRLPTKNQQSQNLVTISQVCVATQYTSVNDQQPVGVATQYTSVNDQQPVGMAERNQPEKSQVAVSVVPSQISSVSVAPQQKRMNIGQQPVGVATQHNQLPVGVVKQVAAKETPKQTVEMTAQQSVDIIQCQVPVLSHQQKSVGVIVQQQSLDVPMLSLRMTPQHATVGVASQQPAGRDTQKQPINAAKSVGVATQQAADITTQQQPINAAKSVGVATQQAADIATQQQPINAAKSVGVATQQAADIATQQQPINAAKSVGVATQQAADITTQKQPINAAKSVGVATQQPAGRATQQQPINAAKSVGVATQQQPINAAKSVGVATQQQPINAARKLVGIAKNSQSKEVDTHQSLGGATQLVNKVQPISTQQATGVATKQPMKLLLHSELSQPVPLDVLIQHQLITSQDRCLTCTLMGCQFIGSLASNGNIISQDGRHFSNPAQWLNNCWSTLGHNKRVDRRSAYSKVNYKEKSLLHYCLVYNQQKVTNYLNRSHDHVPTHKTTPPTDHINKHPEAMIDMTEKHCVCPISDHELVLSNEWLPVGFWDSSDMVLVNDDIINDLIF